MKDTLIGRIPVFRRPGALRASPRLPSTRLFSDTFVICLTPSEFGMANKKKTEESPDSMVTAAKGIGAATGKVAAAVGMATPPKPKVPKLAKKHKNRLPRKQKKAAKKAAKSA